MQVNSPPPVALQQTYNPTSPTSDADAFSAALGQLGVTVEAGALAGLERADADPFAMVDMGNGLFFMQLNPFAMVDMGNGLFFMELDDREFTGYPSILDTFIFDSNTGELTEIEEEDAGRMRDGGTTYTGYTTTDNEYYQVTVPTPWSDDPASIVRSSMTNDVAPFEYEGSLVRFLPEQE
jgi:hypothetical protein